MKPCVSVIVISWNAHDFLEACLRSIRDARPSCVAEVIVVDNASTDGSLEMVASRFPEVTLIRSSSNLGFARANNLAMTRAAGSMFALVNSDALVHPGCLETLSAYIEEHPDVGLVGPRVFGGDGRIQRTCRRLPGLWNTICRAFAIDRVLPNHRWFGGYEVPIALHETLHEPEVLSGCFCVARRSAVSQVGSLDEQFFFYGEDIDWCKRFRDAGWKIAFVPSATAVHFGGGSTSNAPLRYSIEILRATLKYWRKHHGLFGQWLCRSLLIAHHGVRMIIRAPIRGFGHAQSGHSRQKLAEDLTCIRWLLTRGGVR